MPFVILIAFAWIIGSIAEKAQKRRKLAQAEKARQESIAAIEAAKAAERANRERIAREKQQERERIARQKAIDAANKKRLAEMEKQRKKEMQKAQAQSVIDFYTPLKKQLENELKQLDGNPNGKSADQIEKKKIALQEKIFAIDRKLEKADFTLYAL